MCGLKFRFVTLISLSDSLSLLSPALTACLASPQVCIQLWFSNTLKWFYKLCLVWCRLCCRIVSCVTFLTSFGIWSSVITCTGWDEMGCSGNVSVVWKLCVSLHLDCGCTTVLTYKCRSIWAVVWEYQVSDEVVWLCLVRCDDGALTTVTHCSAIASICTFSLCVLVL